MRYQFRRRIRNADIDFKNRTITIDFNCKKPIQFLFKHELTHFGETSELYQDFVDNIRTSSVYLEWLQAKTGENSKSVGKLEGIYRDMVIESRKSVSPVGITEAQQEMYADFCGDVLFSNNQNALNRLMDSLDKKERPKFIQFILDFITYLKEKIAGNKQITLELVKLENQFAKMLNDAKENTDQKGGVKYDFGVTQSDIDDYVDAAYKKENTEDYKKYAKASDRLIADVSSDLDVHEYSHALRDNDIRHIKKSHGEDTNEKYPVTKDDIKLIPWLVENYHKVFVIKRTDGRVGIIYVTVTQDGLVYYLEQATTKYGNEPLLVNKQMIKTGISDIPNLNGLSDAIKQKQSEDEFLADLKEVHEVYAQSVHHPHSIDSITENQPTVNNNSMQRKTKNSISIDNETEPDASPHRDIPAEMQRLIQQRDNGELDADAFTEQMNALYAESIERYGVIPEGENAATPISVPQKVAENKVTRQFVRTILETGKLDAEMIEGIEQEVLLGDIIRTDRYTLILHFAFSILHLYIHRSCVVEDVLLNYACIGFCAVGQNAVKQGLHGTFYPYVLRECICFIKAEKQGAVGNLGTDALYFHKLVPCLIKRQGVNFIKINFTACAFLCCIKYVFCTKAAAKRG